MIANRIALVTAFIAMAAYTLGCVAGVVRTRQVLVELAEEVAARPQNSFARCLTEQWELSGELRPDWKGKRKWILTEQ